MGDLTGTFGGLIIMAHRVNSQTLFKIPSIHIYTIIDIMYVYNNHIYILKYSMQCVKYLI